MADVQVQIFGAAVTTDAGNTNIGVSQSQGVKHIETAEDGLPDFQIKGDDLPQGPITLTIETGEPTDGDDRPMLFVHTDYSPDEVRCFYEIPDALVQAFADDRGNSTIAQALADILATTPKDGEQSDN